jgi:hypothetical protein
MTQHEFITLIKQPNSVIVENMPDLKEMVEHYPYFAPTRLLLAKASQHSNSIHFSRNLKLAAIYSASRSWLYYYIHPEKALSTESYRRVGVEKPSGGYFDMIQTVENEGGDTKQSLKDLAERLKSARSLVVNTAAKPIIKPNDIVEKKEIVVHESISVDYFASNDIEISENEAKKMIKERKYKQAISILRELNLSNPKKSVYFADQIRFLEKVIENSKK